MSLHSHLALDPANYVASLPVRSSPVPGWKTVERASLDFSLPLADSPDPMAEGVEDRGRGVGGEGSKNPGGVPNWGSWLGDNQGQSVSGGPPSKTGG